MGSRTGFDRNASGQGVEILCYRESGKVLLEWKVTLADGTSQQDAAVKNAGGIGEDIVETPEYVRLRLVDN